MLSQFIKDTYQSYHSTLLALSGGADSVALFYLLLDYQKARPDFHFQAFYLNHNMPNNQEFGYSCAQFVKKLCKDHSISFHYREIHIEEIKQSTKDSYENIGRKQRYQFLNDIIIQEKLESITTAHHKDDLVETMLIRLFSGVSPSSLLAIKTQQDLLLRPLLKTSKQELIGFLNSYRYSYLEDPSNQDPKYKRNYVRGSIIPVIQSNFPAFQDKLIQFGNILQEQNHFINSQLPPWERLKGKSIISLNIIEKLNPYLLKESIKREIQYICSEQYLTTPQLEYFQEYILKNYQHYSQDKILYKTRFIKVIRTKTQLICQRLD